MKSPRRPSRTDIDWQQVHARLAQAAVRTREALQPPPERVEQILDERARRLAQPLAAERPAGILLDILSFRLSGECYGIETRYVQEVVRVSGITCVPGVPEVVAGVANLRGQILVVFDIRPLLALSPKEGTDAARIVVCGDREPDLGIVVDAVSEVLRLPADEMRADVIPEDRTEESFVRGLTPDATIVLDGAALLADQRFFVGPARSQ